MSRLRVFWLTQACTIPCIWSRFFFIFIFIAIIVVGLLHQRQLGGGDVFHLPCFFIFLLLPDDNEEEARSSLYPPPPMMRVFFIDRSTSNDNVPFSFFIVTRRGWQGGGGKVVNLPCRPRHALYNWPQRGWWQRACFIFYCYPLTTTRRQGCPCTPPPPMRVLLSALAQPMTAFLFYFLLLPTYNNTDKEARLSLYPVAPDARLCQRYFLF